MSNCKQVALESAMLRPAGHVRELFFFLALSLSNSPAISLNTSTQMGVGLVQFVFSHLALMWPS